MMESLLSDLTMLIQILDKIPGMAMTILITAAICLLIWKLAIIGTIYGVIRLGINKAHSAYTTQLTTPKVIERKILIESLGIRTLDEDGLRTLLHRVSRLVGDSHNGFIHNCDIVRANQALNMWEAVNAKTHIIVEKEK